MLMTTTASMFIWKKKLIHKTSYLHGIIKKNVIKEWLQYLIEKPLYQLYDITVDDSFFNSDDLQTVQLYDVTENIVIDESLIAQQQTLALLIQRKNCSIFRAKISGSFFKFAFFRVI